MVVAQMHQLTARSKQLRPWECFLRSESCRGFRQISRPSLKIVAEQAAEAHRTKKGVCISWDFRQWAKVLL